MSGFCPDPWWQLVPVMPVHSLLDSDFVGPFWLVFPDSACPWIQNPGIFFLLITLALFSPPRWHMPQASLLSGIPSQIKELRGGLLLFSMFKENHWKAAQCRVKSMCFVAIAMDSGDSSAPASFMTVDVNNSTVGAYTLCCHQNSPLKWSLLLSVCCRWGKWDTVRLSKLPMVHPEHRWWAD